MHNDGVPMHNDGVPGTILSVKSLYNLQKADGKTLYYRT